MESWDVEIMVGGKRYLVPVASEEAAWVLINDLDYGKNAWPIALLKDGVTV